jgi:uncharacterized membrane protein
MTLVRTIGIVLIVVGLAALISRSISYTTRDTVLEAGPVEVTREDREDLPLPPVIGGELLSGPIPAPRSCDATRELG